MKWEDALFVEANKNYKIKIGDKEIKTKVVKKYCCGVTIAYFDFMDDIEIEEIKRRIDWDKVPEFTPAQVQSNNTWINQYFLRLNNDKFKNTHPFITSSFDKFIHNGEDYNNTCYEKCRIHESVDIPDEWYKDE